jgi:hypothetical protein
MDTNSTGNVTAPEDDNTTVSMDRAASITMRPPANNATKVIIDPTIKVVCGANTFVSWLSIGGANSAPANFTSVSILLRSPGNSSDLTLSSGVASKLGFNNATVVVPKGTVMTATKGYKFILESNDANNTTYVGDTFTLYPAN